MRPAGRTQDGGPAGGECAQHHCPRSVPAPAQAEGRGTDPGGEARPIYHLFHQGQPYSGPDGGAQRTILRPISRQRGPFGLGRAVCFSNSWFSDGKYFVKMP